MNSVSIKTDYVDNLAKAVNSINQEDIDKICDIIEEVRKDGGLVFTAGNGGSSCIAQHLAEELTEVASRDIEKELQHYKCICLSSNQGLLTCIANDEGYKNIFIRQCLRYKNPLHKNCFIGFTTSGNSQNIHEVIKETALSPIIIFTGDNGIGYDQDNLIVIKIDSDITHVIEDCFQICVHLIWLTLQERNKK